MKYTVLLLYPEGDNEGGAETYLAQVVARTVGEAVTAAKAEAATTNDWEVERAEDFIALAVFEGFQDDIINLG